MYREANETISEGMSLGARIVLGSVSALFGTVMILIAPPTDKQVYFYVFGSFCLLITLACFTRGRVRQFIGSTIGSVVFFAGVAYLVAELTSGVFWSGRRSEPSVLNAVLYLAFIGVPGGMYAYRARFGFPKKP